MGRVKLGDWPGLYGVILGNGRVDWITLSLLDRWSNANIEQGTPNIEHRRGMQNLRFKVQIGVTN
jgi:hypothetical protein